MSDEVHELEQRALEWFAAIEAHNRLMRGIVSGLGLMVFGLGLYVLGLSVLTRACH